MNTDNDDVFDNEYEEPVDIEKFCASLKEAWSAVPELSIGRFFDLVFNGYNLMELSPEEAQEMLDEFILQNQ